jgi:hypothetical protein
MRRVRALLPSPTLSVLHRSDRDADSRSRHGWTVSRRQPRNHSRSVAAFTITAISIRADEQTYTGKSSTGVSGVHVPRTPR